MVVSEEMLESFDQNPLIFQRWLFLADKLQANPELLNIALTNIQNWLKAGRLGNPWALIKWKSLIEAALQSDTSMLELLAFLRTDSEHSRQLKSCSPFPGVLTKEERDQFTCAWTH